MLGAEEARESQQSNLRLNKDKGANIDSSSSSIHSRIEGSTSKQDGRHYFLNTSWTSTTDLEAGYDPANPR